MSTPSLSPNFFQRIAKMSEEEEVDIYTLMLYCMSSDDLQYFSGDDRAEVMRIFKILIEDTKGHAELLRLILDLGGE